MNSYASPSCSVCYNVYKLTIWLGKVYLLPHVNGQFPLTNIAFDSTNITLSRDGGCTKYASGGWSYGVKCRRETNIAHLMKIYHLVYIVATARKMISKIAQSLPVVAWHWMALLCT